MGVLLVCAVGGFALQSGVSPLSNFQLRNDYKKYEEIRKEADVQKQAELLLAFLKERPINRLLTDADYKDYVFGGYQGAIQAHWQTKDWDKAVALAESLLAALPTDDAIDNDNDIPPDLPAEDPASAPFYKKGLAELRQKVNSLVFTTYYTAENWPKATEVAEKLYAAAPSAPVLNALADLYLKVGDVEKYLDADKKIRAENAGTPVGVLALQTMNAYVQKQDLPAAVGLYAKVVDKLDKDTQETKVFQATAVSLFTPTVTASEGTPAGVDEAQWKHVRALSYELTAQGAYAQKDYPNALAAFDKVVALDPSNGDAWYYIGFCKWQMKDPDGAIEPFAKSTVLGKATAERAKGYLEQIYKTRHNDTLDGLDEVLAKAKADLGL
jgi:tetratricopeptide (TPR) repeat protein